MTKLKRAKHAAIILSSVFIWMFTSMSVGYTSWKLLPIIIGSMYLFVEVAKLAMKDEMEELVPAYIMKERHNACSKIVQDVSKVTSRY